MNDPTGSSTKHARMQPASTSPLAGKVALATGASGGTGQAVARRLARDAAAVVMHSPLADVTDEAFERVLAGNTRATFLVLREAAPAWPMVAGSS